MTEKLLGIMIRPQPAMLFRTGGSRPPAIRLPDLWSPPMHRPTKSEILADASALPSPPSIVLELLGLLRDEDVGMSELADVVGRDATLAADLLRLVNSAAYGLQGRVSRLDRALSTIGLRAFRALLAKRSMQDLLPDGSGVSGQIRRRSVVNATLARAFANELDQLIAEDAFLVGLLGSLGHLALARTAGELFETLSETTAGGWPRADAERELLGFAVDEITADLLRSWGMPESAAEAVELRGEPSDLVPRNAAPACLQALRWAQMGEHVLCGSTPTNDLSALLDDVRTQDTVDGLELVRLSEILVETEPLVVELANDLRFDAPQLGHHAAVIDAANSEIEARVH